MRQRSVAGSWSEAPLARSRGRAAIAFKRRGDASVLADLEQQGCLRLNLLRPEPGAWPEAVLLNSGGGIAGGDCLEVEGRWGEGARATLVSQAAEKLYRALEAPARVTTRLTLAAGAAGEWLPQETILFEGARLRRSLEVELAPDARFLGVEALLLGRGAMGERFTHGALRDSWRVRRGGRLLLAEALALAGAVPPPGASLRALGLLVLVAPDAEARLEALRRVLPEGAGASAWDGLLLARFAFAEPASLRPALTAALAVLRDGRALPRVWGC